MKKYRRCPALLFIILINLKFSLANITLIVIIIIINYWLPFAAPRRPRYG